MALRFERERKAGRRFVGAALGSAEFRNAHGVRLSYVAGAMYKGIASKEMVVRMARAGLLSFLGSAGMRRAELEEALRFIATELEAGAPYGVNFLCDLHHPERELELAELLLRSGIRTIEAAAFMAVTPALALFRLKGVKARAGEIRAPQKIVAKISHPEVAAAFMSPAPDSVLRRLVAEKKLTEEEAALGSQIPMAEDVCVESDSGGHTDQGVAFALMPAITRLRDSLVKQHGYRRRIHVGAAGGIGTPPAAAAAFVLGADFILTGSVNQCTVEAGTSDAAKDLLQQAELQDTAYAPAGDMFELGARVQVLRKGLLFPARANRLYELYRRYESLNELDASTRKQIEEKYFNRSFDDVWSETRAYYAQAAPEVLEAAERHPKQKMALIFRWYFIHTTRLALRGGPDQRVDYQIHCGPALGAFNQWVKGTHRESWRERHVDDIAEMIMEGAATVLEERAGALMLQQAQQHGERW
jgi:trans-AT polyketide synthase/acyltransferase/oxidoreductase domain-containing protein